MRIQLSEHFTYKKLLQFVLPSIIMMIFTSIYGIVDGIFVSNYIGKTPFAAVNFIMPVLMILGGIGFMIGTGGSALVSQTMGEGNNKRANAYFSMLVYVTLILGVALAALGLVFIRPITILLGAKEEMVEYCVSYARIILLAIPAFMLQNVFQSFFVTAEKPKLGLAVTVAAGVTNMVLDYLFIAVLNLGVEGAAAATAISQLIGAVIPLFYFLAPNSSLLRLSRAKFDGKALLKTCTNGSSELVTNISTSLVNMLYNVQLMRLIGEDGVSAYGVIMYVNLVFLSIFIGHSIGCAPIVGYHYGAGNRAELKGLFRKSLVIISVAGIFMLVISELLAVPLATVFVGYDAELLVLTCRGFRLYAISFAICGFNIFSSAFFTALGNGVISAAISFLRTLLFQISAVLLLPLALDADGIWLAIVAAEAAALVVTVIFTVKERKRYGYL